MGDLEELVEDMPERLERLQRSMRGFRPLDRRDLAPDKPPPLPPTAINRVCPHCSSALTSDDLISPSGDALCDHCKGWFRVRP